MKMEKNVKESLSRECRSVKVESTKRRFRFPEYIESKLFLFFALYV
jgi:hypothetical protein